VLRASLLAKGARVVLTGGVEATVELPFPLDGGRSANVVVSGDRLVARPRARGSVRFTLAGSPVRLALEEAALALEAPRLAGRIRGRRLLLEGELRGRLSVSASAFPERRAARRTWVVLSASAIELSPATARPAVWFGEKTGRLPRRLTLRNVVVEGDSAPRPELVLYRPTWA
jgi:hypothetical protein